jgi:hypothetical protein
VTGGYRQRALLALLILSWVSWPLIEIVARSTFGTLALARWQTLLAACPLLPSKVRRHLLESAARHRLPSEGWIRKRSPSRRLRSDADRRRNGPTPFIVFIGKTHWLWR